MDYLVIGIIVLVVLLVIGAFSTVNFSNKFAKLGDIRGMNIDEIISKVGRPTAISGAENGTLYQWMKNDGANVAHYVILVDNDGRAVGYTHQFMS
jgi:hypothetical protein